MRLRGIATLKGKEFLKQKAASQPYYCSYFILLVATCTQNIKSVGFILTRKVGSAVVRNKIKRRFRAIVQDLFVNVAKCGFSYILIPRTNCYYCDFAFLKKSVVYCLKNANCLKIR